MPELPEVEATRDNLTRWTVGHRVLAVWSDTPEPTLEALVGVTITGWFRVGKRLAATTRTNGPGSPDGPTLRVQLGMTGRVVRDPAPDRPYQRATLVLERDGTTHRVTLVDLRRLGRMAIVEDLSTAFGGLGPDALYDPLDGPALGKCLGRTRRVALQAALMDQARLAGLGNIAAIEACFRARLHPQTPLVSLGDDDLDRLAMAIADHLAHTLGTALGHDEIAYVSEGGDNPFLVYGREGQACSRCEATIRRVLAGGRPACWCPRCQGEHATPG